MMNSMPGPCGLHDLIGLTALRIVPHLSSCDVLGCSLLFLSIRISNGKASFSSRPPSIDLGRESRAVLGNVAGNTATSIDCKKGENLGEVRRIFQGIWPRMRGYVACHTS